MRSSQPADVARLFPGRPHALKITSSRSLLQGSCELQRPQNWQLSNQAQDRAQPNLGKPTTLQLELFQLLQTAERFLYFLEGFIIETYVPSKRQSSAGFKAAQRASQNLPFGRAPA